MQGHVHPSDRIPVNTFRHLYELCQVRELLALHVQVRVPVLYLVEVHPVGFVLVCQLDFLCDAYR